MGGLIVGIVTAILNRTQPWWRLLVIGLLYGLVTAAWRGLRGPSAFDLAYVEQERFKSGDAEAEQARRQLPWFHLALNIITFLIGAYAAFGVTCLIPGCRSESKPEEAEDPRIEQAIQLGWSVVQPVLRLEAGALGCADRLHEWEGEIKADLGSTFRVAWAVEEGRDVRSSKEADRRWVALWRASWVIRMYYGKRGMPVPKELLERYLGAKDMMEARLVLEEAR